MATLLEEGVCIIKDKEVAERFLKDLENPPKEPIISEEIRLKSRRLLKEGIEWAKKMKL
ncbi:conserved hypothetical protein [Methanocaldococcus sp. FS406-22]|uniref:hypothetical protein n=1 Tax=Methanocaldococcus sp. (strain FS406-22) TaxID=644281 RepID=UPI0001BF1765|nr:hypothetical protein [Methanocaldococcus sp. FS406-22]ADC69055.1 conserved hypothetical protein [Methanocaldococcus sp. FS406-22]